MSAPSKPIPANSPIGMVRGLLDKGYTSTSSKVIKAYTASVDAKSWQRIGELDDEAKRLAGLGEKLTPDNAVLRALVADFETIQTRNTPTLNAVATQLQLDGVNAAKQLTRELALPGLTDAQLKSLGVQWKSPDPEAVNALVQFSDSEAWTNEIKRMPQLSAQTVQNQAIRGIIEGWSPIRTAKAITAAVENVPITYANTLMRTLQLQSYRSATAVYQQANADILAYQIRIAVLDDRTCLACIGLHGTKLPIGYRISDHHNGRCTSIAVVKGREREVLSGVAWFDNLPDARKKAIAGDANFAAMQAGAIKLSDFAGKYDDPVFGEMVGQASLKSILGDEAKKYYPVPTFGRKPKTP